MTLHPGSVGMLFTLLVLAATDPAEDTGAEAMTKPVYTDTGELVRPDGYREWVFVGASLGLDYVREEPQEGPGRFHHVYIQPEAYRHFLRTGEFPDKTILMMENYSAGSKEDNTNTVARHGKKPMDVLHGHYEHERVGLEAAVKDTDKEPELKWSYYFFGQGKSLRDSARAFPKKSCWDCHDAHAAHDNVFLQFYPILREPLEAMRLRTGESD